MAKLAGLPQSVTERAKELLKELEAADISKKKARNRRKALEGQVEFSYLKTLKAGSATRSRKNSGQWTYLP